MAAPQGNPLLPLGSLNRIKAAIHVIALPELNAISGNMGRQGVRIQTDGPSSVNIPAMTGAVVSGEPYQLVTITLGILKTQNLANLYKSQIEQNTAIGDVAIIPDATPMNQYLLTNCSIINWEQAAMDGTDPVMTISIQGTYEINAALWA